MPIQIDIVKDALDTIQAIATIIQAVISTLAVIIAGIWVYRNFVLKREKLPRADTVHEIALVRLSRGRFLLRVFVTLKNTSNVLIRLSTGEVWVQQILPLAPQLLQTVDSGKSLVKELQQYIPVEKRKLWANEIAWPVITSAVSEWEYGEKEIEPDNSIQLRYDFVLNESVQTVQIFTLFVNSAKAPRTMRWASRNPRWMFWKKERFSIVWEFASIHNLVALFVERDGVIDLAPREINTTSVKRKVRLVKWWRKRGANNSKVLES